MRNHFVKIKKLFSSLLFFLGLGIFTISFQNCSNNGFEIPTGNTANSLGNAPSPLPPETPTPPTTPSLGYTFSAEYRASPTDNSGTKICDYPSGANCHSDAEGKSH